MRITGMATPEAAARALAEHVETAVVSRGADGAVAASGGELVSRFRPRRSRPGTRPGRATCSSPRYVAGDLMGLPLAERLRRAVVYAALSVRTATGAVSAATLDELEQALARARTRRSCPNRHPQRRLHELRKSPEAGIARARGGGGAGRSPASRARAARRPAATRRRRPTRHAARLGPGGPRRPERGDDPAEQELPEEVPEHQDQAGREVVHRPPGDAEAGRLRARTRPTSSRSTTATRRWARWSRPGCCSTSNKYAGKYALEHALLDRAPEDEQVHLRRRRASASATSTACR